MNDMEKRLPQSKSENLIPVSLLFMTRLLALLIIVDQPNKNKIITHWAFRTIHS